MEQVISPLLSALLIFALRLSDMTLDTLRLLFVLRGRKLLAGLVGFAQATIFIVALSTVLSNLDNVWNIVGYAGGFAAGIVVGMTLEERMALGFSRMQIISPAKGQAVAEALRGAGYAVTTMTGMGKDGMVLVVSATLRRKDVGPARAVAEAADPSAFVTVEDVRPLARGYFRF
jgi:uncharacterized protein YebE (UPF0316 family)